MHKSYEETPGMSGNSTEGSDQVGGQLVSIKGTHRQRFSPLKISYHRTDDSLLHSLYVYRHIDSENLKDKDKTEKITPYLLASRGHSRLSNTCFSLDRQVFGGQRTNGGGFDE